jgi:hypothetical protein
MILQVVRSKQEIQAPPALAIARLVSARCSPASRVPSLCSAAAPPLTPSARRASWLLSDGQGETSHHLSEDPSFCIPRRIGEDLPGRTPGAQFWHRMSDGAAPESACTVFATERIKH